MNSELLIISISAASIAFFHTLLGPDHYLPFIAISKARKWSLLKTGIITFFCGAGHILSSVILGVIGIGVGITIHNLKMFENIRGDFTAWLIVSFGIIYTIYGLKRAYRNKPHSHKHIHSDGSVHLHSHTHNANHLHIHEKKDEGNITVWVLFAIFVFGPCEPLIPLLMYPAAKNDYIALFIITSIFGFITIFTMIIMVLTSTYGLNFLPIKPLERFAHAIAGVTITLCGGAVFLGL